MPALQPGEFLLQHEVGLGWLILFRGCFHRCRTKPFGCLLPKAGSLSDPSTGPLPLPPPTWEIPGQFCLSLVKIHQPGPSWFENLTLCRPAEDAPCGSEPLKSSRFSFSPGFARAGHTLLF